MDWTPLDEVAVSHQTHNQDVVEAIELVRRVVRDVRVAYLDPGSVAVDAHPDHRAAYFRFPHAEDPDATMTVRQGDGYTHFSCPIVEYHGYLADDELAGLIRAALTGRLAPSSRVKGLVLVEERSGWTDDDGRRRELTSAWRLAVPGRASSAAHSLSFDRCPAVVAE
jgi:hypothetical protein